MAVAGINNVSVLESRWGNQEMPITRTSYIRKMWRDLEEETKNREVRSHMGSQCSCSSQGAGSDHVSITTSELENECPPDHNQMEIRVQNGDGDNGNLCLQQSPAIGTADKERVRQVFREWGSKNGSGRVLSFSHKNKGSRAQTPCENECKRVRTVRQWIESNAQQAETGQSSVIEEQVLEIGSRKSIRMLFGRHDLLDLLKSFEIGRQKEIQSLLENRPVSNFAHRNRLQSLLRGRFLWNQRFVEDKKSTSVAASELGLLRQTHTVSDLRKGFLSRADNDEQIHDEPPSDYDDHQENIQELPNDTVNEQIQDEPQSDTSSNNGMKYHQENSQELTDDIADEPETIITRHNIEGSHKIDSLTETHGSPREYDVLVGERHEQTSVNERMQQLPPTEIVDSSDQYHDGSDDRNQDTRHINLSQQTLEHESAPQSPSPSPSILLHDQYQSDREELEVHDAFDPVNPSENNEDNLSWQEGFVEAEEWEEPIIGNTDIEWHHLTSPESNEGLDANSIENEDEWYQGTVPSDDDDTADNWFGADNRTDAIYTYDGDNSNRLELRELMSRRRVSNLLQSGFSLRLDQLLQSYVERQEQASQSDDEWMLEHEQQDLDQQSVFENDDVSQAVQSAGVHSLPPAIPQHSGTELEIINGLRIDMVRLQEQMNSMQSTLETCMKMQHELRRSVQQEVSSALSRLSFSGEDSLETCFLCCDNRGSDFSPERCGRVHVCSKCAKKINWSKLKESVRHP
ncbi:hypothetical protein CTI12_AA198900 [Artemisia annua]|uniref:Uncharacterized protein n=1 Tax=Artemisia annua TaxID=35608 RepID=A0A2U1P370_ARTAN|nr:hypothetical protein CTI12_AA198900 [Artemisia annua]